MTTAAMIIIRRTIPTNKPAALPALERIPPPPRDFPVCSGCGGAVGVMVRVLTWPPVTVIKDVMGVADHVNELEEDGVLDVVGVDEGGGCDVGVCDVGDCGVDGCDVDGCEDDGCEEELSEKDEVCVAGVIVELVTGV